MTPAMTYTLAGACYGLALGILICVLYDMLRTRWRDRSVQRETREAWRARKAEKAAHDERIATARRRALEPRR